MHYVMLVDDYMILLNHLQKYCQDQSQCVIEGETDGKDKKGLMLRVNLKEILPALKLMKHMRLKKSKNKDLCELVNSVNKTMNYSNEVINLQNKAQDDLSLSSKIEDNTFYERTAVAECIINSSNNFEKLVSNLTQKCRASVNHDFIKTNVLLARTEKYIFKAVTQKMKWLKLIVSDINWITRKILQSDDNYTACTVFEQFLREMYTSVKTYYPSGMTALSKKVVAYVLEHPYEKLTLSNAAEKCFVSKAYLSHSFKKNMGKSYVEYIISLKMQMFKKLLLETDLNMSEIAEKLSYDDYKYMGRLFKKVHGLTPTSFKEQII
ncbi:MAG: AraC family transcriptional regulator [Clostridia bacterium]|nr:AraC family transcriptional regulator [Clostridia bacterium]MCI1999662.1 AraC family transcriptional regulator [Clostridia bacterium]MCI2013959.1 AraC family transcriptional regulator [Clostridia bacterium]